MQYHPTTQMQHIQYYIITYLQNLQNVFILFKIKDCTSPNRQSYVFVLLRANNLVKFRQMYSNLMT